MFRSSDNPLSVGYVYGLAGIYLAWSIVSELQDRLIVQEIIKTGRNDFGLLAPVLEVLNWACRLGSVGALAAFIIATIRRLDAVPKTAAEVFD